MIRQDRIRCLEFLVSYAQIKYGVRQALGVATEPIGGGRSYDFVVMRKLLEQLRTFEDPFSHEVPLWE